MDHSQSTDQIEYARKSIYELYLGVCVQPKKFPHARLVYLIIFSSPPRSPIVVASLSGLGVLAIVDAGPTGYPAREREDLVQLGFFPCNLSNRTIK